MCNWSVIASFVNLIIPRVYSTNFRAVIHSYRNLLLHYAAEEALLGLNHCWVWVSLISRIQSMGYFGQTTCPCILFQSTLMYLIYLYSMTCFCEVVVDWISSCKMTKYSPLHWDNYCLELCLVHTHCICKQGVLRDTRVVRHSIEVLGIPCT